ncbi:MAG: hypothetical protein AAFR59_19645, partial [Bacteroidota bacterium]
VITGASVVDSSAVNFAMTPSLDLVYPTASYSLPYQLVISPENPLYFTATGLFSCQTSPSQSLIFTPNAIQEFEDIDCQANVGSYDPNDKQAFPLGEGMTHQITQGTPLDYLIRFQNTGTDTAFSVRILDTLPQQVNPSTLTIQAASHPYTFQRLGTTSSGEAIVQFSFDPILLPDSGANNLASQGFIKFRLMMEDSLPLGTSIRNRAFIYFDFNLPIVTNETLQTLFQPESICPPDPIVMTVHACPGYTWIDGNTYFEDNDTAILAFTDSTGCDSTFRLDYTAKRIDTISFGVETCAGYTWIDGITYYEDNDSATYSYITEDGCDSTFRLN